MNATEGSMRGMLSGRIAIVTGAGRGIGAAAAHLFAAEGASVVVCDLDPSPAESTAAAIREAGGRAMVVAGDVTDPTFPPQLHSATLDTFGGLDIVVNNAGYTWDGVIHNMSDAQWEAMLAVHGTASFRILREAGRFMLPAGRREQGATGRAKACKVVNVSSVAGLYGNAGQVNYAVAKSSIVGLTKALAKEWGRYNIQVNCLCYGFIETRLTAPKEQAESLQREGKQVTPGLPAQARLMATSRIPLGRPGTPEEAAGPMLFLASRLSDYVSGSVLEVTGGYIP
jgi:3-oxoacyl-[acyl-carrier protein] reductase